MSLPSFSHGFCIQNVFVARKIQTIFSEFFSRNKAMFSQKCGKESKMWEMLIALFVTAREMLLAKGMVSLYLGPLYCLLWFLHSNLLHRVVIIPLMRRKEHVQCPTFVLQHKNTLILITALVTECTVKTEILVQSRFVITLSAGGIFWDRLISEARYGIR